MDIQWIAYEVESPFRFAIAGSRTLDKYGGIDVITGSMKCSSNLSSDVVSVVGAYMRYDDMAVSFLLTG